MKLLFGSRAWFAGQGTLNLGLFTREAIRILRFVMVVPWVVLSIHSFAAEPTLGIDLGNGLSLELVLISKGEFQQGSPPQERNRNEDEAQRAVTITQDFYLGKFPVTRGQFARFAAETGYRTEAERGTSGGFGFSGKGLVQDKKFTWRNPGFAQTDNHPVCIISYNDALAFVNWLSRKSGRRCSLPTEAQWEYACRAGSTTPFYNGLDLKDADEIAWHKANSTNGTQTVGQKKPNAWGLFDMCGNVHEWCRDWYAPYEPGPVSDPEETRSNRSDAPRRVLRGGSWLREPKNCRSASRYRNTPASRNADNGFRVAVFETMIEAPTPAPATVAPPIQLEAPLPAKPQVQNLPSEVRLTPQPAPVRVNYDRSPSIPFGLLFPAGFAVLLIVIVRRALSGRRREADEQRSASRSSLRADAEPFPLETRVGEDGFWLSANPSLIGSVIYYTYFINGQQHTDHVRFEPGSEGQFIYTGGQPSDVIIQSIDAAGEGAREDERQRLRRIRRERDQRPDPESDDNSPGTVGFPPAY